MFPLSLRRSLGTALTVVSLATAACGGGDYTGPSAPAPADVSGSYQLVCLRSLGSLHGGGHGLPVTFSDGGGSTLTFQGGQLVLAQDGTYTLEVEAEFNGGGVTLTDEGNYSTAGNSIDFTPTGSPERMKDGTISGNAMTAQTQFGGIPFEIDLSK
jgi:hypothetical protein